MKKKAKRDKIIDKRSIELPKSVYGLNAIHAAAYEFKDYSAISVDEKGENYLISMVINDGYDSETIKDEFCNFVLGIMKETEFSGQ